MSNGAPNDEGWVDGPTVFAIAWIPKRSYYGQIPDGLWNHRRWYSWWGMLRLTGNNPPPGEFDGPEHLKQFIDTKEYRAIVGFRDVRLRPSPNVAGQYQVEARKIRVLGYTPISAWFHSRGEGAAIESSTDAPQYGFVNRQNEIGFRVGKLLNFLHLLTTFHWLPHASMTLHYSLGCEGDHEITVSSTHIPNVTLYVDWKAVNLYSLAGITVAQAEDFMAAYSRGDAAEEEDRFTITCKPGEAPVVTLGGPPPPQFGEGDIDS